MSISAFVLPRHPHACIQTHPSRESGVCYRVACTRTQTPVSCGTPLMITLTGRWHRPRWLDVPPTAASRSVCLRDVLHNSIISSKPTSSFVGKQARPRAARRTSRTGYMTAAQTQARENLQTAQSRVARLRRSSEWSHTPLWANCRGVQRNAIVRRTGPVPSSNGTTPWTITFKEARRPQGGRIRIALRLLRQVRSQGRQTVRRAAASRGR